MTLRPVPGPGDDSAPLWDRPYIPVKSEDKMDSQVRYRQLQSVNRYLTEVAHDPKYPDIRTPSDAHRQGDALIIEHIRRRPETSPELRVLAEATLWEIQVTAWLDRLERMKAVLERLKTSLTDSLDTSGTVVERPHQFRKAFQDLAKGRDTLPGDLKDEAAKFLDEYQTHYNAL